MLLLLLRGMGRGGTVASGYSYMLIQRVCICRLRRRSKSDSSALAAAGGGVRIGWMRCCWLYLAGGGPYEVLLCIHLLSDWVRLRDRSAKRYGASELHFMLPRSYFYLGFFLELAASKLHARLARRGLHFWFSTLNLRVDLTGSSYSLGSAALELRLG